MSGFIPSNLLELRNQVEDDYITYVCVFFVLLIICALFLYFNPLDRKDQADDDEKAEPSEDNQPPAVPAPRIAMPQQPAAASPEVQPRQLRRQLEPRTEPQLQQRPQPQPQPEPQQARILVVDDSAVVRAKLGRLLESAGYAVWHAGNGVQAEILLGKSAFDLLITDLEMPEMDGFQLIAAVRGSIATENLPIIAITGHDELHTRVNACEGIYGLFRKPWNDREMLRRVGLLVQLHHMQPATEALPALPH